MCRYDNNKSMGGEQEIIPLPDWVSSNKENHTVCIDKCIVHVIKALWEAHVYTLGCCCGHEKGKPSVIIDENESPSVVAKIIHKADSDKRIWDVLQWQLTTVAEVDCSMTYFSNYMVS